MNEKIKQLLLDAGGQYSSGNQNDWPSWVLGDVGVTKFAELIVKECAEVVKNQYSEDWGKWSNRMILEHFGVEELQQTIDFETQDPETAKGTKVKHFGVEE